MENFLENAREKILILDILDKSHEKLTEETLSTFVLKLELMNYFDFRSHLGFLIDSKLIYSFDNIKITDEGRATLEVLREEVDGELLKKVEEELKDYVRDHMAKHKTPRYVAFVSEFPMNAAGKILKYKMREMAVERLKLREASEIVTA